MGPRRFGVEVQEGQVKTSHEVAVPEGFVEDLGVGEVDDGLVVEEAFRFLLDREPASAIQGDFPIDRIGRSYDDFYDELRARLSA
jgi:hypothetical protein